METLFNVLALLGGILFGLFIVGELFAAIYIYRNRATIIPRIRYALGLVEASDIQHITLTRVSNLASTLDRLERKINYIGNHTKFERDELRRRGILRDEHQALRIR